MARDWVWRAAQFAVVVATLGLSVGAAGVYAREAGELRRRFGGKTLAEQHAVAVEPRLKEKITEAYANFPEGSHVRLRPKRSLRYHIFYYETFPRLIVDDAASNLIILEPPASDAE